MIKIINFVYNLHHSNKKKSLKISNELKTKFSKMELSINLTSKRGENK